MQCTKFANHNSVIIETSLSQSSESGMRAYAWPARCVPLDQPLPHPTWTGKMSSVDAAPLHSTLFRSIGQISVVRALVGSLEEPESSREHHGPSSRTLCGDPRRLHMTNAGTLVGARWGHAVRDCGQRSTSGVWNGTAQGAGDRAGVGGSCWGGFEQGPCLVLTGALPLCSCCTLGHHPFLPRSRQ